MLEHSSLKVLAGNFLAGSGKKHVLSLRLPRFGGCGGYLTYPFVKWLILPLIASFFSSSSPHR
jgi:hypothetical protein